MEDGKTIDLLSVGMVREDGYVYYAENQQADLRKANDWVAENVLPHLRGPIKPRPLIAREIIDFVRRPPYDGKVDVEPVEFWGWYADYDWVVVCQLFGRMVDLPEGFPMYCNDFKQYAVEHGIDQLPEQDPAIDGPEHNALADAIWLRRVATPYLSRKS